MYVFENVLNKTKFYAVLCLITYTNEAPSPKATVQYLYRICVSNTTFYAFVRMLIITLCAFMTRLLKCFVYNNLLIFVFFKSSASQHNLTCFLPVLFKWIIVKITLFWQTFKFTSTHETLASYLCNYNITF